MTRRRGAYRVHMTTVVVARVFAFPRAVVWEALVDPVLVAGWLHPTATLVEGVEPLVFAEPEDPARPAILQLVSPVFGALRFELAPPVGDATALSLEVDAADRDAWTARLARLGELLRGHPVEWVVTTP